MKKLLVIMVLVFSQSMYAMELEQSQYPQVFFLWNSNSKGEAVDVCEIGLPVALSVPSIEQAMKEGYCSFEYPHLNKKNLDNFSRYASDRWALQPSVQLALGSVVGYATQVEKDHKLFLDELPISELSPLTIMAVEMYQEPFPQDLYDPWQTHINLEIGQKRGGEGEFLQNFGEKTEIGKHIFGICFAAGGHEEKITLLASERWIEKRMLEETQKPSHPQKEETIVVNDDELGWRKTFSQMLFVLRQKCAENKIAIGGIGLVAAIAAYLYWHKS